MISDAERGEGKERNVFGIDFVRDFRMVPYGKAAHGLLLRGGETERVSAGAKEVKRPAERWQSNGT